jgi:seryl-tRNA(sec) selenium transferase
MDKKELLSSIPKVDDILNMDPIKDILQSVPRHLVIESAREALGEVRSHILNEFDSIGHEYRVDAEKIIEAIIKKADMKNQKHLRRVVNASGVIIHTNLGRSTLCSDAIKSVVDVAGSYSNLEYDLENGERGSRYSHIEDIIVRVSGAESAVAVNNNAGAVLLVLSTLCHGKEAIVSRGELVEIGGSFRIPEVMEMSGARLFEVGTTNKTHTGDYEKAVNENTGAILKVHTSNYRIMGFTESVSREELVRIGNKNSIPVIEDIGSGSFVDFSKYGLEYEPTVQDAIAAGIDIVTFSGDKMLGGPQAGIIAGKKKYIDLIKKNPLTRALRVDKMTLSALEATLRLYLDENNAIDKIPTLRMITVQKEELKKKVRKLSRMVRESISDRADVTINEDYSQIGGGSMPLQYLPTYVVSVKPRNLSVNQVESGLRKYTIPVVARIYKDNLLIDIRTVEDSEFIIIRDALKYVMAGGAL